MNNRHSYSPPAQSIAASTSGVLALCYLATHVDWDPHNDDWDGEARDEGDDHRRSEQHAHLPQNLASLRPWLLAPEGTS